MPAVLFCDIIVKSLSYYSKEGIYLAERYKVWTRPFIIITITNFALFFAFQSMNPVLPLYLQSLGATDTVIGIFGAFMSVGSLLMRPVAGRSFDRYGRKYIMLAGMMAIVVIMQAYAWIKIVALLIALRFIHGICWSFAVTGCNTVATDTIPRAHMGQGMAWYGLANALAHAVGPAFGLATFAALGFHVTASIATAIMVVVVALALAYPYRPDQVHRDKPAAGAPKTVFIEPTAVLPAIIVGCMTMTMFSISGFISLYGTSLGIDNIGFFFVAYACGILCVRPLLANIIERVGPVAVLLPMLVMAFAGMVILSFSTHLVPLLIAGFIYGAGWGAVQTSLQTMAVMRAPAERYGAANGTFFIGFDLGMGIGSLAAGMLSDVFGYGGMYRIMSLMVVIAFCLSLYAKKTIRRKA